MSWKRRQENDGGSALEKGPGSTVGRLPNTLVGEGGWRRLTSRSTCWWKDNQPCLDPSIHSIHFASHKRGVYPKGRSTSSGICCNERLLLEDLAQTDRRAADALKVKTSGCPPGMTREASDDIISIPQNFEHHCAIRVRWCPTALLAVARRIPPVPRLCPLAEAHVSYVIGIPRSYRP